MFLFLPGSRLGRMCAKPAKTLFGIQMIILPLFMLFGLSFLFIAEGEAWIFAAMFVVIWEVACIAILVNAVKATKRIRDGKIEVAEIIGGISEPAEEGVNDFSKKLRDLEALKTEGLISDDEYREKREEMLKAKW